MNTVRVTVRAGMYIYCAGHTKAQGLPVYGLPRGGFQ